MGVCGAWWRRRRGARPCLTALAWRRGSCAHKRASTHSAEWQFADADEHITCRCRGRRAASEQWRRPLVRPHSPCEELAQRSKGLGFGCGEGAPGVGRGGGGGAVVSVTAADGQAGAREVAFGGLLELPRAPHSPSEELGRRDMVESLRRGRMPPSAGVALAWPCCCCCCIAVMAVTVVVVAVVAVLVVMTVVWLVWWR